MPTAADVNLSLRIWLQDPGGAAVVNQRAVHFADHWLKSCAILEFSREKKGNLSSAADEFTLLQQVCQRLGGGSQEVPAGVLGDARENAPLVGLDQDVADALHQQRVRLTRGLLHGVLAGHCLSGWEAGNPLPTAALAPLRTCFESYHRAWNLLSRPVATIQGHAGAAPSDDGATAILDALSTTFGGQPPIWWTHSNWLLVRRLLSYLLGDDDSERVGDANELAMLLVTGPDQENKFQGLTAPVTTALHEEGWPSAYLDPVALGVTVLDDEMLRSLRIAARICRPELVKRDAQRQAVRIAPQPGRAGLSGLQGASAGGLVTLAAYASALEKRLNRHCTASFCVDVLDRALLENVEYVLRIDDVQMRPVDAASIRAKLGGDRLRTALGMAATARPVVYLHGRQTNGPDGQEQPWDKWVPPCGQDEQIDIRWIGIRGEVGDLAALIHTLTGDERIERVLAEYCQQVANEWVEFDDMGTDPEFIQHYIEQRFLEKVKPAPRTGVRRHGVDEPDQAEPTYQLVGHPDADESERLTTLFKTRHRLVVTEDAGAGKSIFSRRAQAWFASPETQAQLYGGQPCLPYRWERLQDEWPATDEGIEARIKERIEELCVGHGVDPSEVLRFAKQHNRLVLIFDALDQNFDSSKRTALRTYLGKLSRRHSPSEANRVIVTGRTFAYQAEQSGLFQGRQWHHCKIDGFSPHDQWRYLQDVIERLTEARLEPLQDSERREAISERDALDRQAAMVLSHSEVFGRMYKDVTELLRVPAILTFIRVLAEQGQRFPKFSNRADLYFQAVDRLFERDLEPGKEYNDATIGWLRDHRDLVKRVLSAVAYQMMLDNRSNYVVQGTALVTSLRDATFERVKGDVAREDWETNRQTGQPGLWALLTQFSILSSHLIVDQSTSDFFGWKHRGMMEFFCGLYLASNRQGNWVQTIDTAEVPTVCCGESKLSECLGQSDWYWATRMALELRSADYPDAKNWPQDAVLGATIDALFLPKTSSPRPTNLMFRAWHWMEQAAGGDRGAFRFQAGILRRYRQQFLDILDGDDHGRSKLAAELWLEEDVIEHFSPPPPTDRETEAERQSRQAPGRARLEQLRPGVLQTLDSVRSTAATASPEDRGRLSYSLCSDATKPEKWRKQASAEICAQEYTRPDKLTFLMGGSPSDKHRHSENGGEWIRMTETSDQKPHSGGPWRLVEDLPAFYMGTCDVTRTQYAIFDVQRVRLSLVVKYIGSDEEFGLEKRAPDLDCPMLHVDWFDAFCFALWLGDQYRLPSECEWEGAAWGGINREAHPHYLFCVHPYDHTVTTEQVNYDGDYPVEGGSKSAYAERTLPVRWDAARRDAGLQAPVPKLIPPAYESNGFGLWHMNGNVYDWCRSEWHDSLDEAIAARLQQVASTGIDVFRSLRGGSWYYGARYSRCANRFRVEPEDRYNVIGFRLSRTK